MLLLPCCITQTYLLSTWSLISMRCLASFFSQYPLGKLPSVLKYPLVHLHLIINGLLCHFAFCIQGFYIRPLYDIGFFFFFNQVLLFLCREKSLMRKLDWRRSMKSSWYEILLTLLFVSKQFLLAWSFVQCFICILYFYFMKIFIVFLTEVRTTFNYFAAIIFSCYVHRVCNCLIYYSSIGLPSSWSVLA